MLLYRYVLIVLYFIITVFGLVLVPSLEDDLLPVIL